MAERRKADSFVVAHGSSFGSSGGVGSWPVPRHLGLGWSLSGGSLLARWPQGECTRQSLTVRASHLSFVFVLVLGEHKWPCVSQCNIDELKKEMNMNFGDWHLFRSTVRYFIFVE